MQYEEQEHTAGAAKKGSLFCTCLLPLLRLHRLLPSAPEFSRFVTRADHTFARL